MNSKLTFFLLVVFSASCSSDYTPKPKGYFHIDLPEPVYIDLEDFSYFKFNTSNQALVEEMKIQPPAMKERNGIGFNLNYPRLNAQIYCSYFRINKSDFPVYMEDIHQMVYVREKKAKGIKEIEYSYPEQKVFGVVYEIMGDAISPVQFVISDSISSFFRGALYFETSYNRDSIAPILAYINKDIKVIIESFQWKQ